MKFVIILNGRPLDDINGKDIKYKTSLAAVAQLNNMKKYAPNIFKAAYVERAK